MGMDQINQLQERLQQINQTFNEHETPENFEQKGEVLMQLAKACLSEAIETFRVGIQKNPSNTSLQQKYQEALHKGKSEKIDLMMDDMDSGLARCMQLVKDIQIVTKPKPSPRAIPIEINKKIVSNGSPLSTILVTANTGSCFENVELEKPFLTLLQSSIMEENADLAVIHFQEFCGKEWKTRNVGQTCIEFSEKLSTGLTDFWSLGVLCYPAKDGKDSNFNALASAIFVKKSIIQQNRVLVWNFNTKTYDNCGNFLNNNINNNNNNNEGGDKDKEKEIINTNNYFVSEALSASMFPEIKPGRKGFLQTKWIIDNIPIDFINVHFFHDDSNVLTYESGRPSIYETCRKRAVDYTFEKCQLKDSKYAFIFGDFNFRLDMPGVVNELLLGNSSSDIIKTEEGEGSSKTLHFTCGSNTLKIGKKAFDSPLVQTFEHDWRKFRKFDQEANEAIEKFNLAEYSIEFAPSYPFLEDTMKFTEYMRTRCPGWCDRILMNKLSRNAALGGNYGVLGMDLSIGDHKPVRLAFKFNPVV